MLMNTIIRENRKKLGLTQEQVAEYIGVSTPAVNKWEKGATYPDIMLLPPLARLLKIDLNTLLCFNQELSQQEISHFCNEVANTIHKSGFEAGFSMGMTKVKEYPNCDKLIDSLALLLDGAMLMYGAEGDKETYKEQIRELYERVAKSEDDRTRNGAIYMLASKYMNYKEYERAQEMLDLLPETTELDKKHLQARIFMEQDKPAEAAKLLEGKLLKGITEVNMLLVSLAEIALKEGNTPKAHQLAELSQTVAQLFDLGEMSSIVALLQVAIESKDIESSIKYLKAFLGAVQIPFDIHKSPLYSHITIKDSKEVPKERQANFGRQALKALLYELESSTKYEFLYGNEEFERLKEECQSKYI